MIDVKGLKKNYGGLQVLKGVDLTINKGDCVVLFSRIEKTFMDTV